MNLATTRRAGVALPLSSLRGERDLGSGTILDLLPLVDWCSRWSIGVVQILPINEAAPLEGSPYKALSAFAIDPSYVAVLDIPEIRESPTARAWLDSAKIGERIDALRAAPRRDRKLSYGIKVRLLELAFAELERQADPERLSRFEDFRARQAYWLEPYALFRALSERLGFRDWRSWPLAWRSYASARLDLVATQLARRVRFAAYVQWIAAEQWQEARAAARRRGVYLKGDLAFVPAANSADVWANPELFDPRSSAGTPPDAFSATGQVWDLPVYDWEAMHRDDYRWWRQRARQAGELYDIFRVDHVIGLYRTYAIPLEAGGPAGFVPTDEARQRVQGHELLHHLQVEAGEALVVGEDLGTVPDWVRASLRELRIPGYRVLRWERRDGSFLDPREYPVESIATTGTHDTESLLDWWEALPAEERQAVRRAFDAEPGEAMSTQLPWRGLIRGLLGSPAALAILPMQDILGWRDRINIPATVGDHNWSYRLPTTVGEIVRDRDAGESLRCFSDLVVEARRWP